MDLTESSRQASEQRHLAEFLLARIAEDEEYASAAVQHVGDVRHASWQVSGSGDVVHAHRGSPVAIGPWGTGVDGARHIARWGPARVLHECEVKRSLITRAVNGRRRAEAAKEGSGRRLLVVRAATLENTLRFLALPYAEHPEYVDEWRL